MTFALSRRRALRAATVLALPFVARRASADAFPARPLRLIIGWPPGGGVDVFARIFTPGLSAALGQPVTVDNIGGASGRLGTQAAIRAPADGYTWLLANDTFAATEALPVEAQAARAPLVPVVQAIEAPNVLVTHPRAGIPTIAAFAAAARARPGALNIGVPGWGTAHHLTSELFVRAAGGLRVEHVPYRGGGPLLNDLVAGTLDAGVVTLAAAAEHIRDGRLVGLAVTTRTPSPSVPMVPTLAATVAPDFHLATWQGLFAPAGTPEAAQLRVRQAVEATLRDPALQARLETLGFDPVFGPPGGFARLVGSTVDRFTDVVREAGIRADGPSAA